MRMFCYVRIASVTPKRQLDISVFFQQLTAGFMIWDDREEASGGTVSRELACVLQQRHMCWEFINRALAGIRSNMKLLGSPFEPSV